MKILLIGASGSIGSFILSSLHSLRHPIILASYSATFSSINCHYFLDICCHSHIAELFFNEPDITHIIFTPELRFIDSLLSSAFYLTKRPYVLALSSQAVYTNVPYSKNKLWRVHAENMIINKFPELCLLRLNMVFGHPYDRNVSRLFDFISRYRFIPYLIPNLVDQVTVISPVFIDDLARLIVSIICISNISGVYNVSGPCVITVANFLDFTTELFKFPILKLPVPNLLYQLVLSPLKLINSSRHRILSEFGYRFVENKHVHSSIYLISSGLYTPTAYPESLFISLSRFN